MSRPAILIAADRAIAACWDAVDAISGSHPVDEPSAEHRLDDELTEELDRATAVADIIRARDLDPSDRLQ